MPKDARQAIQALATRVFPWMFLQGIVYKMTCGRVGAFLDVGCGTGDVVQSIKSLGQKFRGAYFVGVDIWLPYLVEAKNVCHDVVRCDIRRLPFRPSSFDLVIATDVLEHLGKREGLEFLNAIEAVSRKQVFVFTPVGNNVKHDLEDGNPWQAHRSGWQSRELEEKGYRVRGMSGARFLFGERCEYRLDFAPLRPITVLIRLWSNIVTFRLATGAYQMLCIKERNSTH